MSLFNASLLRRCALALLCSLFLIAHSGCGLSLTVVGIVIGTTDDDDDDPVDTPPTGSITTPTGSVNDVVPIEFRLNDQQASPVNIDVRWSSDGGTTYSSGSATGASGLAGHSGIAGLASNAEGIAHTFYWNSFLDLGSLGFANNYPNVRIRVILTQADGTGATLETGDFSVVNRYSATVAGGQSTNELGGIVTPAGLVRRPNGNLVVADPFGQKVVEVDGVTGELTIIAGTGIQGYNGDNQAATDAELDFPSDVSVDAAGHVYIADAGNAAIRRVDAVTGFITTVVGGVGWGFNGDGQAATLASLAGPEGITVDAAGDLWIADTQNHRVRFVNRGIATRVFTLWNRLGAVAYTISVSPGHIATLAGGGTSIVEDEMPAPDPNNAAATCAALFLPRDVVPIEYTTVTPALVLGITIADSGRDRVRTVSFGTSGADPVNGTAGKQFYGTQVRNGGIGTVAGGGVGVGGSVGDLGSPTNAVIRTPYKLHPYLNVLLWIADSGNNRIRIAIGLFPGAGVIQTLAGTGAYGYSGDGRFAFLATLSSPLGVVADPSFNTIIADTANNRVRMTNPQSWMDVVSTGTNRMMAVGGTGTAVRYDGSNFTYRGVGDPQLLTGVATTGPTDIVAVGDFGLIRRFDGTSWTGENSNTNVTLLGVSARTSTDQMACGINGTVLRYNGTSWSPSATGLTNQLNGVVQYGASDARTVGAGGLVLRFNGTGWTIETTTGVTAQLNAIDGPANDAFAVGNGGTLLHNTGSGWTDLSGTLATAASGASVTLSDLKDVIHTGATNTVVVVGNNGVIITYNGSTFTFPSSGTTDDLHGLHGSGPNDLFAVGENDRILHWNGTAWSEFLLTSSVTYAGSTIAAQMIDSITQPPVNPGIFVSEPVDVELDGAGNLFFSNSSTHQILQLDMTTRATTVIAGTGAAGYAGDGGPAGPGGALVDTDLQGVWGAAANDVWAVGDEGVLLRYNGTTWSVFRAPVEGTSNLNDIHGVAANDIWAVGDTGTLLHWNGTAWSSVTGPNSQDLRGVFAVTSNDVFAVGTKGNIWHWDGTSWTQQVGGAASSNGGPIRDFWDVWGSGPNDVWAVGDGSVSATQGPLWHYNGTAWSRVNPPASPGPSVGMTGVFGFATNDVYAVGESGVIYRWNGTAWAQETSFGAAPNLQVVFGRTGSDLFVGGEFGIFGAGLGGDNWGSGNTNNDTIASSVTHNGGFAFPGGAAFLVGADGSIYTQASPSLPGVPTWIPWTLQLGQGQMEDPQGIALYEPTPGSNPKILFVVDQGNDVIRAINLGTAAHTLYPSAAPADQIVIQPGHIATVAGGATSLGDNGIATSAQLAFVHDVDVDQQTGDLYIADTGQARVRHVAGTTGVITTYAGTGTQGNSGDGAAATAAQIDVAVTVTFHRINSTTIEVFIVDQAQHVVRRVDNAGIINTVVGIAGTAGFNTDGVAATLTTLNEPNKLIVVGTDWYITDGENARVRRVDTSNGNVVSTVLGTGQFGYQGDPKPGVNATVNDPGGMVYDAASDTIYVADTFNDRVRRFRP